MAPEMVLSSQTTEGYTESVDWWAFGCILHEMLDGESPFTADTPKKILKKILIGKREQVGQCQPHAPLFAHPPHRVCVSISVLPRAPPHHTPHTSQPIQKNVSPDCKSLIDSLLTSDFEAVGT